MERLRARVQSCGSRISLTSGDYIALLVFGPKKLGELGKRLGEGIRSFRQAVWDEKPTSETKPPDETTKQVK